MIRKDVIVAVLATFCLTATLFMVTTSKSQSGVGEYNPWADYNGDGTIDIFDIVPGAVSFGSEGDPTKNVNVTNWPLDENGNLRTNMIAYPYPLHLNNTTQEITILSIDAEFMYYEQSLEGGVKMSGNSEFAFCLNPARTPFNITAVYLLVMISANREDTVSPLDTTRLYVTINNQTEYSESNTEADLRTLTCLSIPILNSTLIESIHPGINTLQVVVQSYSDYAHEWLNDLAYEMSLLIEYSY